MIGSVADRTSRAVPKTHTISVNLKLLLVIVVVQLAVDITTGTVANTGRGDFWKTELIFSGDGMMLFKTMKLQSVNHPTRIVREDRDTGCLMKTDYKLDSAARKTVIAAPVVSQLNRDLVKKYK